MVELNTMRMAKEIEMNMSKKHAILYKNMTCLIPTTILKSSSSARIMYLWKLNFGFPLQWVCRKQLSEQMLDQ